MSNIVSPPVGYPIQYYPQGDRRNACAGQCVSTGSRGQIRVNYHQIGGGQLTSTGRFIRHIDDPSFRDRPEQLRREGAWGWVPGLEYTPDPSELDPQTDEAPAATSKRNVAAERRQQGEQKVREMAEAGKSRQEISRAVRGFGLNNADVGRILDALPELTETT